MDLAITVIEQRGSDDTSHTARRADRRGTIAEAFHTHAGGLNAVRIILAFLVIASHTWTLGGFGPEPHIGNYKVGTLAVAGFFAISGFLLARSRTRVSGARFVWHRALRLFPAFWLCLVLTVVLFAPFAWLMEDRGSLGAYWSTNPLGYVTNNALLSMNQYEVAGTLAANPLPFVWDGSLWSLEFEALCYAALFVLALVGGLSRYTSVSVAAFGGFAFGAIATSFAGPVPYHLYWAMHLGTVFFAGVLLHVYGDRIPMSRLAAAVAVAVAVLATALPAGDVLLALPMGYALLWLGTRRITPTLLQRNDLSYGMYLYGFPVGQALVLLGLHEGGPGALLAGTVLVTAGFAAVSWLAIERRSLGAKDWSPPRLVAGAGRERATAGVGEPEPQS